MSEMLERVARAAHDAQWEEPFPAEGSIAYAVAMQVARAAIEAMREPTGLMFQEGRRVDIMALRNVTSIYQAMIDEALK